MSPTVVVVHDWAARRALLIGDGLRAVAEWEHEQGSLSDEELRAARQRVGVESDAAASRCA